MKFKWKAFSGELLLLLGAIAFCLPFYFLVAIALKPSSEVFTTSPLAWPKDLALDNFSKAWGTSAGGGGIGAALVSSLI
ncbi:MAG: hypothetical protein LBK28_04255, partial [Propionibacteriaceae bacterium]|nr:hypothetical protein [Propionibacteriaceae bacterium]